MPFLFWEAQWRICPLQVGPQTHWTVKHSAESVSASTSSVVDCKHPTLLAYGGKEETFFNHSK